MKQKEIKDNICMNCKKRLFCFIACDDINKELQIIDDNIIKSGN